MKYKRYGRKSEIIQKLAIGAIILGMLGVAGFVAWRIYNLPEYATDRKIHELAQDYWENYYYDVYVANVEVGKLQEAIRDANEHGGVDPVRLRQILIFDDERGGDARELFTSGSYKCDTNKSTVTYLPKEPYGRADYDYEVNLSCKSK